MEQNSGVGIATDAGAGIAVSVGTEGQSPEERAAYYLAKADEVRAIIPQTADAVMQEILKKLVADWEYLATFVLEKRP